MRRFARNVLLASALALVPSLSIPRRAAAEPTAVEKETARTLMADGRSKREAGDHKGALESFKAAHAIMGVPTTGLEVGRSQADLGMLVEARDTLLAVNRMPAKAGEPKAFEIARQEALDLADKLVARIPTLTITVSGPPKDAKVEVTIDGSPIAPAALLVPVKVNPGAHVIKASSQGVDKQESVTLAEGDAKKVVLVLPVPDTPQTSEPAKTKGSEPESAPPKPIVDEPTPKPTPPEERRSLSPLAISGFVVGGLGLAVGGVAGALELSKASAVKSQCDGNRCPRSVESDLESARTLATISNIGFGVALVGAAVGVVGLVLSGPEKRGTSVSLTVGPASLGLHGAF